MNNSLSAPATVEQKFKKGEFVTLHDETTNGYVGANFVEKVKGTELAKVLTFINERELIVPLSILVKEGTPEYYIVAKKRWEASKK